MTRDFTRGMVATGLLTAVQDRWVTGAEPPAPRTVLRHGLQGGAALAAASVAADALRNRDYARLALAVAAGAAGVVMIEHLLNPAEEPPQERPKHEDPHG
ncbi:hypothetical protein D9623_27275 (plasmid) [Azospirillum brasilense]|uniref:Uncharacterized protein n=1 Tax=Azospirillum brasilense TaxID=192 RepID=A0A0P0EPY1_AZOBR|nr:hypothetical protein AMK58_20790 [Azospirillum brasilense]QCO11680.1 hypothetical protein D3868_16490 [Azospirillum brasilense]QEL92797.1 hypothetical protein D9621_18415 [Azospirillum brasilense]QEL99113.1 hypothetical protein D9623_18660 [Azospirillum brasilense]QEM00477.1 hypothetical protein D9623_27275 [Azospirillum brasilense]